MPMRPPHDGQQGPEDLLAKLSLEEKISLLTGADYWSLHGHAGIGLRPDPHLRRAGRGTRAALGRTGHRS